MHFMSGKALFTYNPDLFADDDNADDDIVFEEDGEKHNDKTLESKGQSAAAADSSKK